MHCTHTYIYIHRIIVVAIYYYCNLFEIKKAVVTIPAHALFINVQNIKCHIFIKHYTTTHSLAHCVPRHLSPITLPQEHLWGLVCPPGCLILWVQILGSSPLYQVVGVRLLVSLLDLVVGVGCWPGYFVDTRVFLLSGTDS